MLQEKMNLLKKLITEFYPHAKRELNFTDECKIFLKSDDNNSKDPYGKTAFYSPDEKKIVLYITNRHPKDIMRSLSHELIHHKQNCDGQFDFLEPANENYAQEDKHLREMEKEAYLKGNLLFRDFEDNLKKDLKEEFGQFGTLKGLQYQQPIRQKEVEEIKQIILTNPQAGYDDIIDLSLKTTGLSFQEVQRHVEKAFSQLEKNGQIKEKNKMKNLNEVFDSRRKKLNQKLTETFIKKEEIGQEETVEIPSYLGIEMHNYHWGQNDPIYKAGAMAYAGRPVPVDLAEEAYDDLESILDKSPEDEELSLLVSELGEILMTHADSVPVDEEKRQPERVEDPEWTKFSQKPGAEELTNPPVATNKNDELLKKQIRKIQNKQ